MGLPAAVRRWVESSSYGPDCLHFATLKDSLHLAYATTETLAKWRFECIVIEKYYKN